MKKYSFLMIFGVIFIAILIIYSPVRQLARAHVNYETAVKDHPLSCTSCHLYNQNDGFITKFINEDYYSPFNLVVSKDSKKVYVIAQDADLLMILDTENNRVLNKIKVGEHPHSVILSKNEQFAYVSNQWEDSVSVIDLKLSKELFKLKTGNGPAELSLSPDGNFLYVVNTFSSDLSVIDLTKKIEVKRLITGSNPTGIAIEPNGKNLLVSARRANIDNYGELISSDITLIDINKQSVIKKINVKSAYMLENIAYTPSGDFAITTLIRPKNNIPSIQVEQGWMMNHGIGIIDQKGEGNVVQFLIDEPNSFYSDPFDIVITPDGKKAFVSSSGVDVISVISIDSVRAIISKASPELLKKYSNNLGISSKYVVKRIKTGANPKGLALSADGKKLFIAEQLQDRILVINTATYEIINSIDLQGPKKITVARRGRILFNNASHTFQNQYACYTCHPDTHEDGLIYNMGGAGMGRNLTNTMTLRDISETGPYKWTGTNHSIYKQDGIRFSTFLTRTEAFSHSDLDALVAYIRTGIKNPPNLIYNPTGEHTDSQLRGKAIFERSKNNFGTLIPKNNRCVTCHPAPYFTNLKLADVSTLGTSDDSTLFDTPHLINIDASPPYLHDGRAKTLEEIWTVYGTDEKHGVVNDLSKIELNELVDYLKSIRAPKYNKDDSKNSQLTHYKSK
ncbi:beta-propeller fold lactonase family protein [Lutibacter sp.]|uniref:beta-propeller fold lactonase family protein n=1 Tax=Lutibacter sp. TaxID=1925666 RepID=UPI0027367FFB|nr:beta-propeller fold lactonase family protein [Lutibacter sp.]MDP3314031.1 beta-propeller fold lactonase family protein [Lutibacter sp.]